ncbi:hypothetical protein FA13DRAFT_1724739, partial [Coprinellus micaceus]
MLRLAQPRQALSLQRAVVTRGYSAPTEGQTRPSGQRNRPRTRAPVKLGDTSDYQPSLNAPAEGSLTSELLRETSGMNALASDLASKRRAARLAREAEQKALGVDPPVQPPRRDRTPRTLTPNVNFDQLTRDLPQQRGDRRGTRAGGPAGDRPRGDRRRPRDGNRTPNGRASKPAPRVLTQNRPPSSIEAAEENIAAEEAELLVELDLPNQPGPAPVSRNLGDIFPRVQIQSKLPTVADGKPSQLVTARTSRRLAGDYSAFVPAPSKDLYTTPVNQLPTRTQLALALAQNKGMDINQRKFVAEVVAKAAGE